jgi:hypothetical protein
MANKNESHRKVYMECRDRGVWFASSCLQPWRTNKFSRFTYVSHACKLRGDDGFRVSEYKELYIKEKCKYSGCGSKKGLVEETKTLKQKQRG